MSDNPDRLNELNDLNDVEELASPEGGLEHGAGVHYPDAYVWLVFVATLDIFFTTLILTLGGSEVNPLANFILNTAGLPGMVIFKYMAVSLVICICEIIARHRPEVGQRLSRAAVVISAIPVAAAIFQLLVAFYT